AHRCQLLAGAEHPLTLTELADHLLGVCLRRVAISRILLPPSSGIRLSQQLDHYTGISSEPDAPNASHRARSRDDLHMLNVSIIQDRQQFAIVSIEDEDETTMESGFQE